jgi:hypothetical protein
MIDLSKLRCRGKGVTKTFCSPPLKVRKAIEFLDSLPDDEYLPSLSDLAQEIGYERGTLRGITKEPSFQDYFLRISYRDFIFASRKLIKKLKDQNEKENRRNPGKD